MAQSVCRRGLSGRYAGTFFQKGDSEGYRYWIEKAAREGHASSVYSDCTIYFDLYREQVDEEDLVKG